MKFKQYLQESTQLFTEEDTIRKWCMAHLRPMTWEILEDLSVECFDHVDLQGPDKFDSSLKNLPVQFADMKYAFTVNNRGMTNLIGTPKHVESTFDCCDNALLSLEHGPTNTGDYWCFGNNLTSLKGVATELNGNLVAHMNNISNIENISEYVKFNNDSGSKLRLLTLDWDRIHKGGLGILQIENLDDIATLNNSTYLFTRGSVFTKNTSSVFKLVPEQFRIIAKHLENGKDVFACQQELIEAGFEEYAQL